MVPFAGLLAALEGIPDPRRRQGRRYPLAPLLLFSVLAVLAGATSYRGISRLLLTVDRRHGSVPAPASVGVAGQPDVERLGPPQASGAGECDSRTL